MVKPIIDLDEIKAHLRIEHDLDNELLEAYADASIEAASNHIGKAWGAETTTDTVKFTKGIKIGCLMYIGHLYANREIISDSATIPRVLPMTVETLWNPYREPAIY